MAQNKLKTFTKWCKKQYGDIPNQFEYILQGNSVFIQSDRDITVTVYGQLVNVRPISRKIDDIPVGFATVTLEGNVYVGKEDVVNNAKVLAAEITQLEPSVAQHIQKKKEYDDLVDPARSLDQ